jgi:hypothetical protein
LADFDDFELRSVLAAVDAAEDLVSFVVSRCVRADPAADFAALLRGDLEAAVTDRFPVFSVFLVTVSAD